MEIGSTAWKNFIKEGATDMAIDIDATRINQFVVHAEELIRWNRKANLTSITEPAAVAVKHFLDSIAPAPMIPSGASLLDIGSGAGFPGIPLKVLRPDVTVTLIDAVRKKVSFLQHVIRMLGLQNIEAHHQRAESLTKEHCFDVIITRALAPLSRFVTLAIPLLSGNGVILALKGAKSKAEQEVSYLRSNENKTGAAYDVDRLSISLNAYTLPHHVSERTLIVVKHGIAPPVKTDC